VLGAIHARGVVHAKLTSAKIYLTQRQGSGGDPYREARLDDIVRLDVGCCPAGALGADASMRLDRSPDLRFQSPEQLGGRTLDARSDVFSLGVLAYEMVTGRPPFPDRPRYAQLVTRLEPPSRHVPLSPRAEAVIVRCLEVDRERRFASTGELRAALLDGAGRETIDP
jgi:serine/threonine-protein kinase